MLLIKLPFCLDDFEGEADVQLTSSERKRPHPWHDNRPFNPVSKRLGQQFKSVVVDFTEFTMSADYIHSAELVNTRYPRQTVASVIQGRQGIRRDDWQIVNRHPTRANRAILTMRVGVAP